MKVHEYQGKEVLAKHGVPVPRGIVITDAEAARAAAEELGGRVVVKAQTARAAASSSPTTPTRRSSWPARSSA
jgi:succinyl-CoA synthetase beta subunit